MGGKPLSLLVKVATLAAMFGVAAHVVGKAARDALFVSTFPASAIPYVFLATGLSSGVAVFVYARLQGRSSPRIVAPALPVAVAVSLVGMWLWLRTGSAAATAVLYAWLTITGSLVISSFWALLSELFDVRTARRTIGLLTIASSVGGLVGAVATHWLVTSIGPRALLLPLAGIYLVMAGLLRMMSTAEPERPAAKTSHPAGFLDGLRALGEDGYLRRISIFVAVTAIAGCLADFVLKSTAATTIGDERSLTEFFATYHGVVGGVTLGVQLLLARPLLEKKGLVASLAVLPALLVVAAGGLFVLPAMVGAAALRGGESSVRNSFHRASYELLFVPVRAEVKRVAKPVVDALVERLADATGAVILIALVALELELVGSAVAIAACGLVGLALLPAIRRGYVASLSDNLADQASALDDLSLAVESDATARHTLQLSLGGVDHASLRQRLSRTRQGRTLLETAPMAPGGTMIAAAGQERDPRLAAIRELCASEPQRVERALEAWDGRDRCLLPFIVEVIARDDLYEAAIRALGAVVDRHAGALSDELSDVARPLVLRKRIPRVLAQARGPRAAEGLFAVLGDDDLSVRYHAARALRALAARGLPLERERIWEALRREVAESLPLWEAQRLMADEGLDDDLPLRDRVARRGAAGLRHVFNLLALVLEPESVDLAYRAVVARDEAMRGVALEYLEHVLPPDLRAGLWPYVGDAVGEAPPVSRRAVQEVLAELKGRADRPPAPRAGST